VTLIGSGFTAATGVTFGGVPATRFTVVSPYRIVVTPPPLSAATACVALPATGAYAGETTRSDLCQVAVQVVNANGPSAAGAISAPYEGTIAVNALGDVTLPAGCGCENVTAPDEYDYVPAPHITSVSTSSGPAHLASERGNSVITIRGTGLNPLVLDWANFGNPRRAASVDIDYKFLSGTVIKLVAPEQKETLGRRRVPLTVTTIAGRAVRATATYAGIPVVTGVATVHSRRRLAGVSGAADTGGTALRVTGRGFAGQVAGAIGFLAVGSGTSAGTDYRYSVRRSGALLTDTVAQTAALVNVRVCSVTGCSVTDRGDRLWLYAPGAPRVTSIAPSSGPAAGGTRTVIRGADLGCPLAVFFGRAAARSVTPGSGALDCGATAVLTAKSPPGTAGRAVRVGVLTVGSYFTRALLGSSAAVFHYR
jgi:hypothetical protein